MENVENKESYQKIRRQTAKIVKINDLNEGKFIKKEGFEPSYITTKKGLNISRANIIGSVITNLTNQPNNSGEDVNSLSSINEIHVDDGSGNIPIRSFDQDTIFKEFNVGDFVQVIGKPREYNSQKYIACEVIKQIKDKLWIDLRKVQIKLLEKKYYKQKESTIKDEESISSKKEIKEETISEDGDNERMVDTTSISQIKTKTETDESESNQDKIFNLIKTMDLGEGTNIQEIIEKSNISETEDIIMNFLKEGDIFEVSPGKVKVL